MLEGRFLDRIDLSAGPLRVEAVLHAPMVSVRLQHVDLPDLTRTMLRYDEGYRLELCLTSRPPTRLNFVGPWGPHRYEAMGRFFVLPPGQLARVLASAGASSAIVCHLDRDIFPDPQERDLEWTNDRLAASANVDEAGLASAMMRIAEEVRHPGFASDLLIQCYAQEMAIHLHRYFRGAKEPQARGGMSPWRLRIIDDRLRDGANPPSLVELAGLCNLSVRQLSRGFHKSRGISIGDYVGRFRFEHAMTLLRQGQPVKSVALAAGFKSAASFCYAFRKTVGLTPGQYRADALLRSRVVGGN